MSNEMEEGGRPFINPNKLKCPGLFRFKALTDFTLDEFDDTC